MDLNLVFQDYEARLASIRQQEVEADAREQYIAEFSKVQLLDRLAAQTGMSLVVATLDGRKWSGEVESVGLGWFQMKSDDSSVLIPTSMVLWCDGENSRSLANTSSLTRSLSYAFALRALVRYRLSARIFLEGGYEIDGMLERVGADFIEIKMRQKSTSGASGVAAMRTVPLGKIAAFVVTM